MERIEREGDDVVRCFLTAQQFERVMYRITSILRKMGLGAEFSEVIGKLSRLIMMARMVTMTLHFLEMETPYGWLMGAFGAISVSFSAGEFMGEIMYNYDRGK